MKYTDVATQYAEKHGVVRYAVVGNTMMYKESFLMEKATYSVHVNLDTMQETRTPIAPDRVMPIQAMNHPMAQTAMMSGY